MKYNGSCHCGDIEFSIELEVVELTTCDCSLCIKKNALMTKVHEDNFTLIKGEGKLSDYRWNTHIAQHYFCSGCGIYTFHRKRAQPDHYGINIHCLDDFDSSRCNINATQGANMTVIIDGARKIWPGPRVVSKSPNGSSKG